MVYLWKELSYGIHLIHARPIPDRQIASGQDIERTGPDRDVCRVARRDQRMAHAGAVPPDGVVEIWVHGISPLKSPREAGCVRLKPGQVMFFLVPQIATGRPAGPGQAQ